MVNTGLRPGGAPWGAAGISAQQLPGDLAINELKIHLNVSAECMQSVKVTRKAGRLLEQTGSFDRLSSPGNGADGSRGGLRGGGRLSAPQGGGLQPGEPQSHPVQLNKTSKPHYLPAAQNLAGMNRAVARMGYDLISLYPTEELSRKAHAQI